MKLIPKTNNAVIEQNQNHKMKRRRRSCGNICLLIIGTILICVGLSIFFYFETLYDLIVVKALDFNPQSKSFRAWQINDPAIPLNIYIFNWTNPKDIGNPNIKPKFEEIGPYRFNEIRQKINITWNNENDTISYRHLKSYFFDPENSVRNLSDMVTIINAVPLTIAYKTREFSYLTKMPISYWLSKLSSLYVTKTAGEILFDGYEELILSVLSSLPLMDVVDKFGMFYGTNGTAGNDGIFNMFTKTDGNFGRVTSWNYRNTTNFYEGECSDVRGSAGEFFQINPKRDYIEFFSAELCKFARLEYEKDVVVKGVRGYKYTAKNLFDNGTLRPENSCFCKGECVPFGVLNVSECRGNSPTFLSMPHFYNADPFYINSIEGISPTDDHEFYITLEPKSGIVIDIAARMQVNLLLQPIKNIEMYTDVPKLFFPIFYFEQNLIMTDELASSLLLIQNMPEICKITVMILISIGLMSLFWLSLNIYCCSKNKLKQRSCNNKIPQNTYEDIPLRS